MGGSPGVRGGAGEAREAAEGGRGRKKKQCYLSNLTQSRTADCSLGIARVGGEGGRRGRSSLSTRWRIAPQPAAVHSSPLPPSSSLPPGPFTFQLPPGRIAVGEGDERDGVAVAVTVIVILPSCPALSTCAEHPGRRGLHLPGNPAHKRRGSTAGDATSRS